VFADALDEDDEPGGQGGDEATAGESADVTEEPDADVADALFSVTVPDR